MYYSILLEIYLREKNIIKKISKNFIGRYSIIKTENLFTETVPEYFEFHSVCI